MIKLFVTKDAISHRGKTVNSGDVIEESDSNHIGALQSVGCQIYDPAIHKAKEVKAEPVATKKAPAKKKHSSPDK
jgi:hypothetical protein